MRILISKILTASALGAMLLGAGPVRADTVLPPVHKMHSVEYLSGGIGLDKSKAIEDASRHWPLTLEFAAKDRQHADYLADVKVHVLDVRGHDVLDATSDGPFLLAKLPPGSYAIAATADGKTLHEHVVVKEAQPARAVFVWTEAAHHSAS